MATIYKRGKTWHIQYYENGNRVQRSLGTNSKRIAEQKMHEIEVNLSREQLGMGRRLRSSEEVFRNFEVEVISKKSPPWQLRMEQLLRPFRQWVAQQAVVVSLLTKSDIEGFPGASSGRGG